MDGTVSKALQVCSPPYNVELGRASTEQVHLPSLCNSSTSSAMDVLCNMVTSCEQDGFLDQPMQHGAMHHIDKASNLLDILYYGGVGGSEPNKQLVELMDVEENDHHHANGHYIGLLHPALVHQGYPDFRHFKLPLLEQEPEASENKEESKLTGVAVAALQQQQQQPTCSTASVETKGSTEVRPSARRNLEMAIRKQAVPSVSCSTDNQRGAGRAAITTATKRAHLCSYEEEEEDEEDDDDDEEVDDDERRKGCQQASKKIRLHATSAGDAPGPLPGVSKVSGGGQRMTHIAVERNRRKQMNEHLAILRSLMPTSYVQRGDQASIIGGVVEFIKELQQLLASLEAQKRRRAYATEAGLSPRVALSGSPGVSPRCGRVAVHSPAASISPRGGRAPASAIEDLAATSRSELADVEVKLSGAANVSLRTLSHVAARGQLLLLVAALQSLSLEILHLNITTLQRTVLYTFTLKIGIECRFSVDDLATAVQEIFRNIHTTNTAIPQ